MMKLSKENITLAKKNNRVIFIESAFQEVPGWEDMYVIFKKAYAISAANFVSPGTLAIDNSEKYSDVFNKIINNLNSVHSGNKIAVLSIVHFVSANDNTVPETAEAFYKDFVKANPNKLPPDFDFSLFKPTRHSDPVDGFYIQCTGQALWKVFYSWGTDEYLANPGDALYIPKGIEHSVESMNVRSAISVSFFDKDEDL
jgi:mannose-6-phosphate isomerase-like protein (cupin superfamily)